tara:strand:- start:68 stop:1075 length:1008 start_codon:yes stop_codon:yes gene_type:complete
MIKMDILKKYLNNISYKFPKGYPDMKNEEDKDMLFKMINELLEEKSLLTEGSKLYDDVILNALYGKDLEGKSVPISKNKYKFGGNSTFDIQVQSDDLETWKKLWSIKPPKSGKEVGSAGSLGVGNGEISLYWLYQYSNSGTDVTMGREGDDPDLRFNGKGVEVKAYDKHTGLLGLGRFGADKENLRLLGLIFGLNNLTKVLGKGEVIKSINPTNFKGIDLIPAMENVIKLKNIDLGDLASSYPLFATIKNNIDSLVGSLGDFNTPEEGAANMAHQLVTTKLERKPGTGGYLASLKESGDIRFFAIDLEKLKTNDDFLSNFQSKQSSLGLNFDQLF